MKKLLLLAACCLYLLQDSNAQAKKIDGNNFIWADLQADYFLENQSFFFFRSQFQHNLEADFDTLGIVESGPLNNIYKSYVLLGYDQKLTEHWRAGVSARYTFNIKNRDGSSTNNQIYQAMLQHNGKIGETDFIKKLAFDLVNENQGNNFGRIRPMMALERNFKLGSHILRPHFSYELFFYNDFKDEEGTIETRTVDRTRLRLAAGFQVGKSFWLTPYFIKQTEYFNVLSNFTPQLDANGNIMRDADGNEILIENKGGKRNRIEPIFGLELRFLLPVKNVSENTIPNLGNLSTSAE